MVKHMAKSFYSLCILFIVGILGCSEVSNAPEITQSQQKLTPNGSWSLNSSPISVHGDSILASQTSGYYSGGIDSYIRLQLASNSTPDISGYVTLQRTDNMAQDTYHLESMVIQDAQGNTFSAESNQNQAQVQWHTHTNASIYVQGLTLHHHMPSSDTTQYDQFELSIDFEMGEPEPVEDMELPDPEAEVACPIWTFEELLGENTEGPSRSFTGFVTKIVEDQARPGNTLIKLESSIGTPSATIFVDGLIQEGDTGTWTIDAMTVQNGNETWTPPNRSATLSIAEWNNGSFFGLIESQGSVYAKPPTDFKLNVPFQLLFFASAPSYQDAHEQTCGIGIQNQEGEGSERIRLDPVCVALHYARRRRCIKSCRDLSAPPTCMLACNGAFMLAVRFFCVVD